MTKHWDRAFLEFSCEKLQQLCDRICTCLDKLDQGQLWSRGSGNENAVGNLVLHLCGNVRQWIGSGVAGLPDIRTRDLEFIARGGVETRDLKERLRAATAEAVSIIAGLTAERLLQAIRIQGYELSALEAVYHVVEHFAGHAGQIIYVTKHFTGEDMGFYAHLNSPGSPPQEVP